MTSAEGQRARDAQRCTLVTISARRQRSGNRRQLENREPRLVVDLEPTGGGVDRVAHTSDTIGRKEPIRSGVRLHRIREDEVCRLIGSWVRAFDGFRQRGAVVDGVLEDPVGAIKIDFREFVVTVNGAGKIGVHIKKSAGSRRVVEGERALDRSGRHEIRRIVAKEGRQEQRYRHCQSNRRFACTQPGQLSDNA